MFSRLLIITTPHQPSINRCETMNYIILLSFFWNSKKNRTSKKTTRTETVELEYVWKWRRIRCETSVHYYGFWACLHHLVERFLNNLLKLCQKKRKKAKKKDEKICRHREYTNPLCACLRRRERAKYGNKGNRVMALGINDHFFLLKIFKCVFIEYT